QGREDAGRQKAGWPDHLHGLGQGVAVQRFHGARDRTIQGGFLSAVLAFWHGLARFGAPAIVVEDGAPILGAAGLSRAGHGIGGEANAIGVAPVVGDGFAAHFDLGSGVGLELAAVQKASGAGGEAAGETDGVVAILHEPIRRDIAFSAIEEAGDGCAVFFERGAGDAGEVAGVEVGVTGDGGGMNGEEEQERARLAVAEDLDEPQGWIDRETPRAASGCAVGTGGAEAMAAVREPRRAASGGAGGTVAARALAAVRMPARRGSGLAKKGAIARLRWMPGALP